MSEEEVIRRRLIFDGDGTGEDRRLNVLLKMISKWVKVDESDEDSQATYDKILSQLSLVEYSRHRSQYVSKAKAEQLHNYETLYTDMEEAIEIKNKEIDQQRKELVKAKIIKQHRIQYDLLAKSIAKEPPRTSTNKKLKTLQKELADLAAEKKQLDQKLNIRKKQFNVIATSASYLVSLLNKNDKSSYETVQNISEGVNFSGPEPMSE
ncbi:THO complex subunit 7 homolog [Sitophilus oryzae]|uniref:THO complex subunit 7 homolog n=1 Tax=Sitophilus oryzae TaxID=7048 RepID=A0A6J2XCN2_SITOR|nr:THO complex subunit 7 homolog [Sitophilus oryzae]